MSMRMTGMFSGMDTESIIQELVSAKRTKVDTQKKAQTKLEWKQDAWKDLNTKLKNLQSKYIANMRFSDAYSKKTTKVSNSSAVSVITGEGAVNGVQTLEVSRLAKTAYLTGGKIQSSKEVTALTTLGELDEKLGDDFSGTITVGAGDFQKTLYIDKNTSISTVLNTMKEAGLNASYDVGQKRFFVSAKSSGEDGNFSITSDDASGQKALKMLGISYDANAESTGKSDDEAAAHYTKGQNAEIYLNGAKFTNSTNVFEINGLTFTALSATAPGETVTVTTEQDTDGIYDMVKNFLKEYNSVINEMDKLYNADSAKGYEPLTDDEKESLSDSEVEKYEKKIKDALLRRDDNLSTVNSALQQIMSGGVEVGGKTMYLSDFGIDTLGYFTAAENEKHAYHIDGDSDDASTAGNADKLKTMISNDPDTVISFFTSLSQKLYGKMTDLSKSVDGYRTFGNFYDDKKMKSDYDDYTSKIKELEKKLQDYEDKWYSKFSKMETALAKMQSNSSAVTGLLGGS